VLKFRSGSENSFLTAGIKNQSITVFLTSDTQEKKSLTRVCSSSSLVCSLQGSVVVHQTTILPSPSPTFEKLGLRERSCAVHYVGVQLCSSGREV